jgi:PmbA protein
MTHETTPLNLLTDVLSKAVRKGADAADAVYVDGKSLSLTYRLGKQEQLERSENTDLGLRVFVGKRQAVVSTSDLSAEALTGLVDRAVAMARAVPEDPYCGLAEPSDLATDLIDVDGCDTAEPTVEVLLERAARAEDAARAVSGVTNSEGAETGWGVSYHAIAATNGFARAYSRSRHSLVVSVLAGEGTAMERDYDYTSAVHGEDLRDAAEIGRSAGEKAVGRLHPKKVASAQVPVIYQPRVAASLLGHLSAAINGAAVARGTTFLRDKLDAVIFPRTVNVIDDPLRRRGPRSRPFDAEGIPTRRLKFVEDGMLRSWFLDLRAARQLDLMSTGHASRGISTAPSPSTTNLYMEPGGATPQELLSDVKSGLYVTELIGFGVNGVTGDYSRGAGGYWIEDGKLAYPVSEITIAGNLLQMFANITVANDLEFRYGTDTPTLRVDGMTVAGR